MALARRWARLEPELTSARDARRLLRDSLAAAGVSHQSDWADSAELAVHEVVANAVLHAHTPIEVTVEPTSDRVRVEVRDYEPTMPSARDYDSRATTGRGMGLVAAITDECGARSLGAAGKVVWFAVGWESVGTGEDNETADTVWDVDMSGYVETGGSAHSVLLASMPVRLWLAARQHHDALLRELALYVAERDLGRIDLALADQARRTVSRVVAEYAQSREWSQGSGWESEAVDLEVRVPALLGPAFVALQVTLDTGERLASQGQLLARPGLPEIVEVRDWVCGQVAAQLGGELPTRWPGTAQPRFETLSNTVHGDHSLPADAAGIRTSARAVVAADVANRIVAVSPPLARLLGWDPAELVGRRLITIIPPELREAHIAGFSEYLSTADGNFIGRPIEVPALHRDGSRVRCRLLVEEAPGAGDDVMFVAWLEPLGVDDTPDRR